jgi:hypothetical protein
MPKFVDMDEKVPLSKQMEEEDTGPIVFVNKFAYLLIHNQDIFEM